MYVCMYLALLFLLHGINYTQILYFNCSRNLLELYKTFGTLLLRLLVLYIMLVYKTTQFTDYKI